MCVTCTCTQSLESWIDDLDAQEGGIPEGGGRCRGVRGLAQHVCYMHMHTAFRE